MNTDVGDRQCQWGFFTIHYYQFNTMYLKQNHQQSGVFRVSKKFVLGNYRLAKQLPAEKKVGMVSPIRRATHAVHLNIAEGVSEKSKAERKRYYEISTGSIIETDATFDIAKDIMYLEKINARMRGIEMLNCNKLLTGMIKQATGNSGLSKNKKAFDNR